jgi:LacI family transcriptional regulator
MIRRLGEELDGVAIICKNVTPLVVELQRIRNAGKPVLAVVSDLERSARSAYLGIDNRAAGQMAAYLLGRHLEYRIDASVAVVVGNVSYRCHEDREIGFRSLLRQKFSNIELLEVVGNDSSEIAYDATLKLFATKPNLQSELRWYWVNTRMGRWFTSCKSRLSSPASCSSRLVRCRSLSRSCVMR